MSKIKVVQVIALSETYDMFLLDNKGRVWEQIKTRDDGVVYASITWKQLELPNEPV